MLENIFIELVRKYSSDPNLSKRLWLEIESNYSAKSRHYHNFEHLRSMLADLTFVKKETTDWDALLFALFYHDIVYIAGRHDNEQKSAEFASVRLAESGVTAEKTELVSKMIIATKTHETSDSQTTLLLDADLAILGKNPSEYNAYRDSIRKEFSIYPDLIYKPGRRNVLKHFLEMDRIYKSDYFFSKYERQARQNIMDEISVLR